MADLPALDIRMEALLENTAETVRPCKACGVKLYFVRHRNGHLAPYTFDGTNHFINCPHREQFKQIRRPASA
jgi:hypothetical protein